MADCLYHGYTPGAPCEGCRRRAQGYPDPEFDEMCEVLNRMAAHREAQQTKRKAGKLKRKKK